MTAKLTDPASFLSNLLVKRGCSDLYGIYLTGVNVLSSAEADYGYGISLDVVSKEVETLMSTDSADWNSLLVELRRREEEIVHPISFIRHREPVTVYFILEGNEMSAMVFIPTLVVDEFKHEVTFYQGLLREVSKWAGKNNSSIRFTIGAASMQWEDLVEQGHAREVDVGF
jgi:hypothetical protein